MTSGGKQAFAQNTQSWNIYACKYMYWYYSGYKHKKCQQLMEFSRLQLVTIYTYVCAVLSMMTINSRCLVVQYNDELVADKLLIVTVTVPASP